MAQQIWLLFRKYTLFMIELKTVWITMIMSELQESVPMHLKAIQMFQELFCPLV